MLKSELVEVVRAMNTDQIMTDLRQFTGTETWWKYPLLKGYTYTDGVKYVAESCKAYWLIDAILSHQTNVKIAKEEFQVWILTKKDTFWLLRCEDGNNHKVIEQKIGYSDFPLDTMTFWLTNNVLLLPSEY